MPSKLFRQRLQTQIDLALAEYADARALKHPGLIGRVREIAVSNLFMPLLAPGIEAVTGKIGDSSGNLSKEVDLVLYARALLPAVMYSGRDGVFPIEAALYGIEVKSRLTRKEVRDAVAKARKVRELRPLIDVFPVFCLFAFSSDLDEGSDELARLLEEEAEAAGIPPVQVLCVVGRGYWWYAREPAPARWFHIPATVAHDEVLSFMGGTFNTIPDALVRRGRPRFGNYILSTDPYGPYEPKPR